MKRQFYVYIMSNVSRTLYVGMTSDLGRRVCEHKEKQGAGFTSRYNVTMLVYVETFNRALDAIEREKQLKSWTRAKKLALVEMVNPEWVDAGGELLVS